MQLKDEHPGSNASSGFNPFPVELKDDLQYPVRDASDIKLEAADLFSLFTADIIKEAVPFTR